MSKLEVILCESLENSLAEAIEKCPHDRLFILTDEPEGAVLSGLSSGNRAASCCGWGGGACAGPSPRSGGCARA